MAGPSTSRALTEVEQVTALNEVLDDETLSNCSSDDESASDYDYTQLVPPAAKPAASIAEIQGAHIIRLHQLDVKLENTLQEIEEIRRKNRSLEEQLLGARAGCEAGMRDAVRKQHKDAGCLVLGDSVIRNMESERVRVQCFPGNRTEQLQRVMGNQELESPDTVVFHVGTNDIRRSANLDYVMEDAYDLVNKAKTNFPKSKLVLSGVLRRRDVSWRRIGAINSRYDWIAKTLGVTFVDLNSWVEDWDFGRDGLHMNRSGTRRLSQLYSRVCGFSGGGQKSKE
ncbi:hypothetical protein B7P43_G17607 [Cryptotermes secundus]|uniref:SGNH hydrolase-type esterase domain-containing protein n=1 Tax=Cryptotermes secundus TaxID=105785 RepID=A0A2J7Q095_9NEOP|nr:hypothetical protein B7P43_G17607 [Cryptotermes secundus]